FLLTLRFRAVADVAVRAAAALFNLKIKGLIPMAEIDWQLAAIVLQHRRWPTFRPPDWTISADWSR
ncbi:hypothetical protein ABQE42_23920, partial [Mycolicibacterium pulveris]